MQADPEAIASSMAFTSTILNYRSTLNTENPHTSDMLLTYFSPPERVLHIFLFEDHHCPP
jgi:hypothetical protein